MIKNLFYRDGNAYMYYHGYYDDWSICREVRSWLMACLVNHVMCTSDNDTDYQGSFKLVLDENPPIYPEDYSFEQLLLTGEHDTANLMNLSHWGDDLIFYTNEVVNGKVKRSTKEFYFVNNTYIGQDNRPIAFVLIIENYKEVRSVKYSY